MSQHRFGKIARAAVLSGALGAAGLVVMADVAHAQDPSPSPSPSPEGTTGGTGTDGTTGGTTTVGNVDMPATGMELGGLALVGGAALAGAAAVRRLGKQA